MSDPVSKLQRILNPQTAEDYRLSVDLRTIPEVNEAILEAEQVSTVRRGQFNQLMKNVHETAAKLALNVLMGGAARPSSPENQA